jgi:hypothetical protein
VGPGFREWIGLLAGCKQEEPRVTESLPLGVPRAAIGGEKSARGSVIGREKLDSRILRQIIHLPISWLSHLRRRDDSDTLFRRDDGLLACQSLPVLSGRRARFRQVRLTLRVSAALNSSQTLLLACEVVRIGLVIGGFVYAGHLRGWSFREQKGAKEEES